jgi:hypothetical protein
LPDRIRDPEIARREVHATRDPRLPLGVRSEIPGSGRESASGARGSRGISALRQRRSRQSSFVGAWKATTDIRLARRSAITLADIARHPHAFACARCYLHAPDEGEEPSVAEAVRGVLSISHSCHSPCRHGGSRNRSLDEVRCMWNGTHEWLGTYVASLERKDLRRAVFAHPVADALTVRQAVALIDVHVHTYTRQIRRLQRLMQSADLPGPRA